MDVILDLFGQPVVERRQGPGRPPHVWTVENSNKINLLFACGHAVKDVAAAIGITAPTLRKVYFSEVGQRRHAALKFRARQLERLNAEADKGNVTAEKALAAMLQGERMKVQSERFDKPAAKAAPKGLKAERKDAAWDAGKDDEGWGPLLHGETGQALPN